MNLLRSLGYPCGILKYEEKSKPVGNEHPFKAGGVPEEKPGDNSDDSEDDEEDDNDHEGCGDIICGKDVRAGNCKLVFGHPEAFLSSNGRKLLRSPVYQKRVVACVIDEVHCVMEW